MIVRQSREGRRLGRYWCGVVSSCCCCGRCGCCCFDDCVDHYFGDFPLGREFDQDDDDSMALALAMAMAVAVAMWHVPCLIT